MHINVSEGFRNFFEQLDKASYNSPFIYKKCIQL